MRPTLRPLRIWMTGCVAVVSLALGGPRAAWADARSGGGGGADGRLWQASRFGLAETLQRLQAGAQAHGLGVLIRWTPDDPVSALEWPLRRTAGARLGHGAVLVFESLARGGTPVVMKGDSTPDLPLSLCVRSRLDGCAEVLLPPDAASYGDALPRDIARDLTELPGLVKDALG